MSSLSKFFKSKKSGKPETQVAIQKLRETHEMLTKKSAFLEGKVEEQISIAKRYGLKNKRMALQALSRKRNYEKQLAQIDGTLNTIDSHIEALENAGTNVEVLSAMRYGSTALKNVHNKLTADDVQNIMDDIQEQRDICQEISSVISTPMGLNSDFDEDDLLRELEELEAEGVEQKLLDINRVPDLPTVPDSDLSLSVTSKTPASKKAIDDDIGALAEWAN
ncbi:Charged multivesicular body protein [Schistosoma japonicum]|uniref:Charged multivesicular body protein n=1 Tax=Schistosoma japonicum TaxID=6182 RepID=A0A4Z2CVZ4_SCHJA|nr:Charged multivesicular body protein [Schistosoma japonicum]